MKTIRPVLLLALTGAAFSCSKSAPSDTVPPSNQSGGVEVSIASVTLADDCGTGPTTIPDSPADVADSGAMQEPAADVPMGDVDPAYASQAYAKRACEQSSIQLRVANGTAEMSRVMIQKVELVDASGTVVAELAPREPSQWANDSYRAWDEQVAPSAVLQVSYALSAPYVERGATYTVRVVVAADGEDRTLERQETLEAEASMPPDAVT